MLDSDRVSIRTKAAFGVGAIAEGATLIGFNSFNLLYYNQVLKVSGSLVGLAAMIAILLDALVDPIIGSLSDRWRSRLGRRHPFLFAAPLPVALSFYFIYRPPSGFSEFALFVWLTIWTVLLRQSLALFTIPHLALGAELSANYTQRSAIMSWNTIFSWVGSAGVGYFGWSYFFAVRDGVDQRFQVGAYHSFGTVVAVVSCVVILCSALFTLDQLPRLPKAGGRTTRFSLFELWRDIGATLRNQNYRALVGGLLFFSAALGIFETLSVYNATYFWALSGADLAKYSFASAFGFWGAFFLTTRMHHRFDKKPIIILGITVLTAANTGPVGLRFLGLMPHNGSPSLLPMLLAFFAVSSAAMAMLMISVMSALADVADEHELHCGRRQEGIFYASRIFFGKAVNALGHGIGGVVLDVIAFPKDARPGAVAPSIVDNLAISTSLLMVIPSAIAIFFYARYRIDKRTHARIREELAARRAVPAAPPIEPPEPVLVAAAQP
jgi:Na+/melibiose symporter-like transporter